MSIDHLIQTLQDFKRPASAHGTPDRKAAVAIVLSAGEPGVEMLMIRRAVREGDPWSGHMGFPGGRRDPEDSSSQACAARETHEEIGLDLGKHGALLCELSDVNTGWRPDRPEMLIAPFVYWLDAVPTLSLNHEVDDVVWVPLGFFQEPENRQALSWEWRGKSIESDAYYYDDNQIWGLSLMMIDELLEIVPGA
ncbi:MAG: CoA pyrophosphatase [Proteobacteria bacterium]|nr:CoA pyrophosphatase [Pseudomonadota bacterium]